MQTRTFGPLLDRYNRLSNNNKQAVIAGAIVLIGVHWNVIKRVLNINQSQDNNNSHDNNNSQDEKENKK